MKKLMIEWSDKVLDCIPVAVLEGKADRHEYAFHERRFECSCKVTVATEAKIVLLHYPEAGHRIGTTDPDPDYCFGTTLLQFKELDWTEPPKVYWLAGKKGGADFAAAIESYSGKDDSPIEVYFA